LSVAFFILKGFYHLKQKYLSALFYHWDDKFLAR
jgi:hypothetical protein